MLYHVYMHCILSGGLTPDGGIRRSKGKFFLPVFVLRDKFKGKYLAFLDRLYQDGSLSHPDSCAAFREPSDWLAFRDGLYRRDWCPFIEENDFYPGYPIIKRALYYCSRMNSSQYGSEFTETHYEKIRKVYSIWICPNPPKKRENTITRYCVQEENLVGQVLEQKEKAVFHKIHYEHSFAVVKNFE